MYWQRHPTPNLRKCQNSIYINAVLHLNHSVRADKSERGRNGPHGFRTERRGFTAKEAQSLFFSPTVLKPVQLMENTYTRSFNPDRKQQAHLDTLASGFTTKTTACLLDPSIPSRTFCSGVLRSTPLALQE
ncbi:hypothetical protein MHYP_G00156760 [Metynnis hypsauchen]